MAIISANVHQTHHATFQQSHLRVKEEKSVARKQRYRCVNRVDTTNFVQDAECSHYHTGLPTVVDVSGYQHLIRRIIFLLDSMFYESELATRYNHMPKGFANRFYRVCKWGLFISVATNPLLQLNIGEQNFLQ